VNGRQRAQRLATILDGHAGWERRTLADLRTAGFKFQSIDAARAYRKAAETLARMGPDELIQLVANTTTNNRSERRTA
jgi:hypothetical protein